MEGNISQGAFRGPHNESHDYKEALLPPDEQMELNELRMAQTNGGPGWTEEKRLRFLELSKIEATALDARIRKYEGK